MKTMRWDDFDSSCELETQEEWDNVPKMGLQSLVAAATPELGERYALAEEINQASNKHIERTNRLRERINLYMEHQNLLEEQRLDLISTASAPPNVNDLGHRIGWDKTANDSPSRRTAHKLKAVESETNRQLEHAQEMLSALKEHQVAHNVVHRDMEKASGDHIDFQEAVAHSRILGQKEIDKLRATLNEHVADHKRFSRLIANARKAKS